MTSLYDSHDLRILYELERHARISFTELARITGKGKDSIRYRIAALERNAIISRWKTWIDYCKLGYQVYTLVCKVLSLPKRKQALLSAIRSDPHAYWLGVGAGAWDVAVSYFFRTPRAFFEKKLELLTNFGDLIVECTPSTLVNVGVHEKSFLYNDKSKMHTFTYEVGSDRLDHIDNSIVALLYNDPRVPVSQMAEHLRLSTTAIRKRLSNLHERGIIIRYSAMIDYQKLGLELYKCAVYLRSARKEDLVRMLRFIEKSQTIIHVVKQIAPWDYELVLFVKNFAEYTAVMNDFTERFSELLCKTETTAMSEDTIYPCREVLIG
jgi:Lrp/AsnC family leucine-responsive transcriptional regulator